jgi:hypothetical protein
LRGIWIDLDSKSCFLNILLERSIEINILLYCNAFHQGLTLSTLHDFGFF